jgi:large subunit ribosomal protein L4
MYRAAISTIVSDLLRNERLVVLESLTVESHKTKDLVSKLADMKATDVFVITDELDKNLELASRNLPRVDVADVAGINPVSLLRNKKVLITKPALEKLGAWLG